MRLAVALLRIGNQLGFADLCPTKRSTLTEQGRQQLGALGKKWDEAQNNNDAAALAALLTQDAVFVTKHRSGLRSGSHREMVCRRLPGMASPQP